MTGLTWRPVREDDRLDPGDRVRSTVPVGPHAPYTEFWISVEGYALMTIVDAQNFAFFIQRDQLEVPR